MKNYTGILAFLFCLIFGSCSETKVINNPEVMATNTRSIEIERIEISDTVTVFHLDAYNSPGKWVRIASETYLEGNVTGKQYKLLRSEGFELDKEVSMPESGNIPFKLFFEPADKKDTALEFVEGHGDGAFIISGIQLKERSEKGKIKCHISGTVVDRPQSSRLMLMPWNSDFRVYPWVSVPIHDGKFDYTFYVDIEEAYDLIFYEEPYQGGWRPISFFAEEGEIVFTLYPMDKWGDNVISTDAPLNGISKQYKEFVKEINSSFDFSPIRNERALLNKENRYYSDEYKKWMEDIRKATPEESDNLYKLRDKLQSSGRAYSEEGKALNEKSKQLETERDAVILEHIKNNPSLPTYYELVLYLNTTLSWMEIDPTRIPDPAPYFTVYEEVFKNKYPDHPYTWKMEMLISGNALKTGGRYIDFSAPDAKGKEFKLSEQISGKVALIDLWASWCGPCRRSAISMIPVYEKYKGKGFTIVGVARESNVADMVRAAEKDGYTWLCLVELKDRGKIWEKYGIGNAGGGTFLVNKTGTILAVNPTAEQVAAILEQEL